MNILGDTSLHIAARNDEILDPSALSKDSEEINKFNSMGWTPLMFGAFNGHIDAVTKLLTLGADVNMKNNFGGSVIALAAASGSVAVVRAVLEANQKNIHEFDIISPLAIASLFGHLSVARFLISRGYNPNSTMPFSDVSPLMLAVFENHFEIVKLLVDRNAVINHVNVAGQSALDLARLKGHTEIVKFLKLRIRKKSDISLHGGIGNNMEEVLHAIQTGNLLSLRKILSQSPSLATTQSENNYGDNTLRACHYKNGKKLFPSDADFSSYAVKYSPSKTKNFSYNEDHYSENKSPYKCSLNEQDGLSRAMNPNNSTTRVSGVEKEKISREDSNNETSPLALACTNGHTEAVRLLIGAGADPNRQRNGRTPLMLAAVQSNVQLAKLLLSAGADPLISSSIDNLNAFDLASLYGASTEMMRLLAFHTMPPPASENNPTVCNELDFPGSPSVIFRKLKQTFSPKTETIISSKGYHCSPMAKTTMWQALKSKRLRRNLCELYPALTLDNNNEEKKCQNTLCYGLDMQCTKINPSQVLIFDTPFRPLLSDEITKVLYPTFIQTNPLNQQDMVKCLGNCMNPTCKYVATMNSNAVLPSEEENMPKKSFKCLPKDKTKELKCKDDQKDEFSKFIKDINLERYIPFFKQNEINDVLQNFEDPNTANGSTFPFNAIFRHCYHADTNKYTICSKKRTPFEVVDDLHTLLSLKDGDLEEMGIESLEERSKILSSLCNLYFIHP